MIKSRSITFFSVANPVEEFGSFFGESKVKALEKVADKYKPKSFSITLGEDPQKVIAQLNEKHFTYPIIIKPNWGERGVNVAKVHNDAELIDYLSKTDRDSIIQTFIGDPFELGVFYYRHPETKKSAITGIVNKGFLTVIGNGKSTIRELMEEEDRARFQIERLRGKFPDMDKTVLAAGEKLLLEPIGNHNRGTMFLDGSYLINDQVLKVFDDVASTMHGFYYGRFDVKVKDWDSLNAGNITILEVNGIYSEPAHIYDPNKWTLFAAYKEIMKHFSLIYEISEANRKRGYKPCTVEYIWKLARKNYFQNKQIV
jgi:hypothetical protein